VKLRPDLLTGLPGDSAEALARVLQRHHEQVGSLKLAVHIPGERAFAIIHLRFLARQELEHIEALRLPSPQFMHEALHRVVAVFKAVPLDQVLVNARGVAPELHLRLDPCSVRLARREFRSRWPGWRTLDNLTPGAGGHPGGFCFPGIATDGFSIDAGYPLDLALAGALFQQRFQRYS
jgi:hypothetical protein